MWRGLWPPAAAFSEPANGQPRNPSFAKRTQFLPLQAFSEPESGRLAAAAFFRTRNRVQNGPANGLPRNLIAKRTQFRPRGRGLKHLSNHLSGKSPPAQDRTPMRRCIIATNPRPL